MTEISCIIINYNTSGFTVDCVRSLIASHDSLEGCEIIVVDNASEPGDFQQLQQGISQLECKQVRIIRSRQNLGFGGGNMLGVQHASNPAYYAFINNDTLHPDRNGLWSLKKFLELHPQAGVCSPQMLDQEGKFRVTLDHFAAVPKEIFRRPVLEFLFPKKYLNRKKTYDQPTRVDYVQGSYLFVRAVDFDAVGGFDTNLFLYYEESDLCRRLLRERKQMTYLVPDLHYIHFKGSSTSKSIAIKMELKLSLLYVIRKHYGFWAYKTLLTHLQLRYFFSSLLKPKYFPLFRFLLRGAPLSESMKHKQPVRS